jgi:predicted N-acetyltransferase YhbS
MAYPFHGISKSIESAFRTKTPKAIVVARLREGYAYTLKLQLSREEQEEVIQIFDVLLGSMDA